MREHRENELVFSLSREDYITRYNSLWQGDYGRSFFTSREQWRQSIRKPSIHTDQETHCFYFSEDAQVHPLPTVTVYVPPGDDYIQEITVNFDEHSYSESGYEQFKKMCVYTLKVFLPDLSQQTLQELCTQIITLGNQNVFSRWYGSDPTPCALFHRGGVGVYPYFAMGDWSYFCIIPVTPDTICEMEQKGVAIYEME